MQGMPVQSLVREDPHTMGQLSLHQRLSPCAATAEAECLAPAPHKRSRRNDKPVHHGEEQPLHTKLETAHQQQGPSTAKNK